MPADKLSCRWLVCRSAVHRAQQPHYGPVLAARGLLCCIQPCPHGLMRRRGGPSHLGSVNWSSQAGLAGAHRHPLPSSSCILRYSGVRPSPALACLDTLRLGGAALAEVHAAVGCQVSGHTLSVNSSCARCNLCCDCTDLLAGPLLGTVSAVSTARIRLCCTAYLLRCMTRCFQAGICFCQHSCMYPKFCGEVIGSVFLRQQYDWLLMFPPKPCPCSSLQRASAAECSVASKAVDSRLLVMPGRNHELSGGPGCWLA